MIVRVLIYVSSIISMEKSLKIRDQIEKTLKICDQIEQN